MSQQTSQPWWLTWTGATREELPRVLRCLAALFFLFLSYYLVKPLRNSQFLKEFPAQALPWIYLAVSVASLVITRIFQWLSQRVSRSRLVTLTFLWAMACKLVFVVVLPHPALGQVGTVVFFMWASIYFLLLVSTLWGCLNERFRLDQAQRCFAFIALGSTLGNILGAQLADWMARAHWTYGSLLWSAVSLGISLLLLLPEFSHPIQPRPPSPELAAGGGWWHERSLRAIATMVMALAIYTTGSEFITQRRLDQRVTQEVYAQELQGLWPGGYEQCLQLRSLSVPQRHERLLAVASTGGCKVEDLEAAYARFRDGSEQRLRSIFASIFKYQGILGVLALGVICRPFLRGFGLGAALLVLPTYALLSLPVLLMPLDILAVQALVICSGTLNYSFNNAVKEVLYTCTDSATLMRAKPIIEGPIMRLGDVICAVLTLVVAALQGGDALALMPCLVAGLLWWFQMRGVAFNLRRRLATCASDTSR